MNQQQRKYAKIRILNIYDVKLRKAKDKHLIEGKTLTGQQRASLLRRGKVRLKKCSTAISSYADVVDIFDFSAYEYDDSYAVKLDRVKIDLQQERDRIMDELMLGNSEDALKWIKKFQKFKI